MFQSFYLSRRWLPWSLPGGALILFATWYKVEIDVKINEWFGDFYNLVQKALARPNAITMSEYMEQLATFGYLAGLYVAVAVFTDFFIKHYVFKLGFRDGWAGFVIAFGNFEGTFYRYAKRYEELQAWQPPQSKILERGNKPNDLGMFERGP